MRVKNQSNQICVRTIAALLLFLMNFGVAWAQNDGCFKAISAGSTHTIAIKTDGSLWAWGQNSNGQFGDGTTNSLVTTSPVRIGSATNWARISAGGGHTVALKTDGSLWAWGANNLGQLGIGTTNNSSSPVQIGNATDWVAIGTGLTHSIALKTDGSLWAWGANNLGQLGIGTNSNSNSPVQIGTATNWISFSAGHTLNVAKKTDGSLWAWGRNNGGQLGIGTNSATNSPVQIGTATDWASYSAAQNHVTAIKTNGTLWAWGDNTNGEIGAGDIISGSTTPIQIGTATDWASTSSGNKHTIAIKTDGSLWAWGSNFQGQLGDGSTTNRKSPVKIGTATNWVNIFSGNTTNQSFATQYGGSVWAWGMNNAGQLGDGTQTQRLTPTSIACPGLCTPTAGTFTISACNSYTWAAKGNRVYTASNNTDTIRLINAAGCDSVVTLNLTINQATTSTTTQTATGSYSWNGNSYTSSGTYTWTGTNSVGCDSVATLYLTIGSQSNAPVCDTYSNIVASGVVNGVFTSGNNVYAATTTGLSISTDGGTTFINKTTANGLGGNYVYRVCASGSTIYASTKGGLSISTDGGATFTNKTTTNGLGDNDVRSVFLYGSIIYAATGGGLSISTDGGTTFINKTTADGLGGNSTSDVYRTERKLYVAILESLNDFGFPEGGGLSISTNGGATFTNNTTANGLGSNSVKGVFAYGSNVYAATRKLSYFSEDGGLAISTDGGATFTNKTTANGLATNQLNDVYVTYQLNGGFVTGSTIYAVTDEGLSISTDGGTTFTNKTTANGLGDNKTNDVYASGSMVYVATKNGVSTSTDGGATFINKTLGNGLGSDYLYGVFVSSNTIYASTLDGLSISTNGGTTFSNKTTANGLGDNRIQKVYVSGSSLYAATFGGGLGISTDGGNTFTNKTTANGLGFDIVYDAYVSGSNLYAATYGGLSMSTDGGNTFTNKTTANGLGSNVVYQAYVSGSNLYAATVGGLSISTDGGTTFTNKTTANGLGANTVYGVYVSGSIVYAATIGGLSISTDGGNTFTNKTTANGLGSDFVYKVFAMGNTIYASTLGGGLSISTDGGSTFTNYTTTNGLGGNNVPGSVFVSGNTIYVPTDGGLSFCSAAPICTPTTSTETLSACGSYLWNGTTYTTSGAKTFTTTNAAGCDSVVTLNLTINNATSSSSSESVCGSYLWNGTTYTTSGAKTFTTTNAAGCDSVVTLNLTINNATTSSATETATGSYVWNGNTYTSSGTYTYQTTNAAGCDSTATLNLTINPAVCIPTSSTETIAACFSYTWNGVTYTTSGTRTWIGTNAAGCDSVATLILKISTSIYPPSSVTQTAISNVCSSRVYRYTASVAPVGTIYNWILPTSIGGVSGVTVDSGDINSSRTILVRYTSNEAAFTTDSIKVRSFNGCTSRYTPFKLSNIKLSVPSVPAVITVTSIGANNCSNRKYRFSAPALPGFANSSTTTILPATGYLWSFVGNLREFAFIDSGDENSQKIVVSFSSNAAAVIGDSIKLQYLSSCGNSNARAIKLSNTKLNAPAAPATITISALQTNVCGARRYRYSAPNLPVATTNNGAATGYVWSLVGSLSGTATIDSGNVNSQKITVTFTSNTAALTGDSIRLNYTSDCGNSARKASKLTNTLLGTPSVPATITMQIKSDVCNARTYRYIAPAVLPVATSTIGAASGYLWSTPTGTVGSTGTIDSGNVNSRIITVTYTSNAAAGVGDSIRLRYTSGCGDGKTKAQKLSNLVKNGCAPINPIAKVSGNNEGSTLSVKVYPNPTKNQFSIQISSGVTDGVVIRVLDMQGRFIQSVKTTTNQTISIGSKLKAGVYLLEVTQGKEVKTIRVVKF